MTVDAETFTRALFLVVFVVWVVWGLIVLFESNHFGGETVEYVEALKVITGRGNEVCSKDRRFHLIPGPKEYLLMELTHKGDFVGESRFRGDGMQDEAVKKFAEVADATAL